MNKDILNREDKKRSQALEIQLTERQRVINEQIADKKNIYQMGITAAENGADNATIQKLQSARTPQEALSIAGTYLGANFRRQLEQDQFSRKLQEAQFNLSVDKFNEDIRQYNEQTALDKYKVALAQSNKSIQEAEDSGKIRGR